MSVLKLEHSSRSGIFGGYVRRTYGRLDASLSTVFVADHDHVDHFDLVRGSPEDAAFA